MATVKDTIFHNRGSQGGRFPPQMTRTITWTRRVLPDRPERCFKIVFYPHLCNAMSWSELGY